MVISVDAEKIQLTLTFTCDPVTTVNKLIKKKGTCLRKDIHTSTTVRNHPADVLKTLEELTQK